MSLRSADAYAYASFRATLADSDCNAILSNGAVLPVLIEDGGEKLYTEIEYRFYDPKTLPNFVRFELRHEEKARQEAEAAKAAEPQKTRNFQELQQQAQQTARNTMVERYGQNRSTNGDPGNLSTKWAGFAEAGKRARDAAFRSN